MELRADLTLYIAWWQEDPHLPHPYTLVELLHHQGLEGFSFTLTEEIIQNLSWRKDFSHLFYPYLPIRPDAPGIAFQWNAKGVIFIQAQRETGICDLPIYLQQVQTLKEPFKMERIECSVRVGPEIEHIRAAHKLGFQALEVSFEDYFTGKQDSQKVLEFLKTAHRLNIAIYARGASTFSGLKKLLKLPHLHGIVLSQPLLHTIILQGATSALHALKESWILSSP